MASETRSSDRVRAYYERFDEASRLDSPAGQLELECTLEVLDDLLEPPMHVLDLGGGAGRYTVTLARRGHRVTLVDLSPRLVAEATHRIAQLPPPLRDAATAQEGDARDLSPWPDATFDAAIALGPFYHLVDATDRTRAATELSRVLRPGGVLIAAFIPRLSGLRGLLQRAAARPDQVRPGTLERVLRDGVFLNATDSGFQDGWYPQLDEVDRLFVDAGFEKRDCLSLKGIASEAEAGFATLRETQPDTYERAVEALRATARDTAVVELGGHALWCGRRG